jgi:hypothetical protein
VGAKTRFVARLAAVAGLASPLALAPPGLARETAAGPRQLTERIDETSLEVSIEPGRLALDDATLAALIGGSLRGIAGYYGKLPVDRASVVVTPSSGRKLRGSTRCSGGTGRVALAVGRSATAADFIGDWIVTHELLHVVFTSLIDEAPTYDWVGEGLASYVEPLVRVRAGTLTEAALWHDLLVGAPQGLPLPGDQGLNRTHTWGRTYWGGALFWLEADLAIRNATDNQKSLRDALRAVAAAGTNVCVSWPMERVLATADAATGTRALGQTYARRALTRAAPDIDAWWAWLGVSLKGGSVAFDDTAPGADTRRRMTTD